MRRSTRVYLAAQQRRHRMGRRIAIVGGVLLGAIGTVAAQGRLDLGVVPVGVLVALAAGLAAWGFRLATEQRSFVEVDSVARSASFTVDGQPATPVSLDQLAPLAVSQRTSIGQGSRPSSGRIVIDFIVHLAGRKDIVLAEFNKPGAARRHLQTLARAWSLSAEYMGGGVIAPGDLGRPLHERLARDPDAARPVRFDPSWGVTISTEPSGHIVRTQHRAWDAKALYLLLTIPMIFAIVRLELLPAVLDPASDPAALIVFCALALVAAGALATGLPALRDRIAPGELHIGAGGVRFRGRAMDVNEVEEVVMGAGIDILGATRSVSVPITFAPEGALVALRHEIQRLIIDAASRR